MPLNITNLYHPLVNNKPISASVNVFFLTKLNFLYNSYINVVKFVYYKRENAVICNINNNFQNVLIIFLTLFTVISL